MRIKLTSLALLAVLVTGCTSTHRRPVQIRPSPSQQVERGDTVHVVMQDGRRARVWVGEVTADYVQERESPQHRYYFRDMKELVLEERDFNGKKTAIVLLVAVPLTLWLLYQLALASLSFGLS